VDGPCKVVADETLAHGHARVDFGDPGTAQSLGDIIERGNLLGPETPSQGRQWLDLLSDPRPPAEGEFYVQFPD
jgi:hypothetical protein